MELWSDGTSCILPSLPFDMYSPSLDILAGLPVACYDSACTRLTGASWVHYQYTKHRRNSHTSAVLEEGLLLVGGMYSFFSTEIVPVDGGAAREGFSLDPGRSNHCSIQVTFDTAKIWIRKQGLVVSGLVWSGLVWSESQTEKGKVG